MNSLRFARPLELLLRADTWQKKRQILEQHQQVLCTNEAIQCLTQMLQDNDETTDEGSYRLSFLLSYRWLLANVAPLGLRAAWAEFRQNIEEVR